MSILMVTGIEGARNCADVVGTQLGMEVEVAEGRKARWPRCASASFSPWWWTKPWPSAIRRPPKRSASMPAWPSLCRSTSRVSGAARLIREIRAALHRREREQTLARRAAAAAIEAELKTTVAGLLLHSQLALQGSEVPAPVAERLRMVADLAGSLRQQLSAAAETRRASHL